MPNQLSKSEAKKSKFGKLFMEQLRLRVIFKFQRDDYGTQDLKWQRISS